MDSPVAWAWINIRSRKKLQKAGTKTPGPDLERDLAALVERGEVSVVNQGASGGFDCIVHLFDRTDAPENERLNGDRLDEWLERLAAFLANWGVPSDTKLEGFLAVGPNRLMVYPARSRRG